MLHKTAMGERQMVSTGSVVSGLQVGAWSETRSKGQPNLSQEGQSQKEPALLEQASSKKDTTNVHQQMTRVPHNHKEVAKCSQ